MRRLLKAVCAAVLMLGFTSTPAASDSGQNASARLPPWPAQASAPAAGAPPATDGGLASIHASRIEEARALVPPLLRYGQFQPVVGTYVEYDFRSQQGRFPVRAAVVGETKRPDGSALYQVELDYGTQPRTLIVLWVIGGPRPMIDRLAVSVPPTAPISIPVDLFMDQPELRGTLTREQDTELRMGPFAGKARQRTFRLESGRSVVVVATPKVPLFGVESIRDDEATWIARKSGTGARPELGSVPIAVPRMPGQ